MFEYSGNSQSIAIRLRKFELPNSVLIALHALGLFGLTLHFKEVANSLSSFQLLLLALVTDSHLIRQAEVELIGIYFSYFGWIAIPLSILSWRVNPNGKKLILLLTLLQFILNLGFIDRTRPIWLIFISIVIWFPFRKPIKLKSIITYGALGASSAVAVFFAIGFWIGKTGAWFDQYDNVTVSNEVAILYYYLTGGYAYFDEIFMTSSKFDYLPVRTFYPLSKILEKTMLISTQTPSQILDFLDIPYPTNVATFLYPLYQDGGLIFCIAGVIGATFIVDRIGYLCLRSMDPFCVFLWANLCLSSLLAFFVPKQNATQLWMFAFIALISFLIRSFKYSASRPPD